MSKIDNAAHEDADAGKGGSYEADPVSGARKLVERTQPADGAGLKRMPDLTDPQKEAAAPAVAKE